MANSSTRMSTCGRTTFQPNRLARSIAYAILTASIATPVLAVEFNLGDVEGRFDSQLSIGSSWRQSSPSADLISVPNGGTSRGSGSYDDGTQNFKDGDAFSTVFKGVHDLQLNYQNYGAFVRGKYWYDFELENGKRAHGHAPNGYQPNTRLNDDDFNDYAKFSGAELLDAYVFAEFEVNERPLDVRLGRQVVNWGESTFIQGGINVINPFDVTAFRRAGAEVKEGLLPVNMAFGSLGVTDNLSLEAFYQLQWEPTAIDGCGTYFSTNDFTAEGCDGIRIISSNPLLAVTGVSNDQTYFNNLDGSLFPAAPDLLVNRDANGRREADDAGQFGAALRYFAEELNSTEFGLYFAKYHSRLPIISGIKTDAASLGSLGSLGVFQSKYFVEYPEDIKMLGLSFSSSLGDVAWSGEISHKRDVPVQMNGPMLVASMLALGNPLAAPGNPANSLVAGTPFGGEIHGFTPFNVTQAQTSFVKFADQVMGASRLTLVGELGWTHIHDFDEGPDAIKYGRNGIFGFSPSDSEGFVTQNSYGYVVRANLAYSDVFAGVNLKPEVSFKHGLSGYGPQPGAAFNEDEKTLSLSLTADYLNQYSVQLAYTDFFGGNFNPIDDRDFISLSASMSF